MLIVSIFRTPIGFLEVSHDKQHLHRAEFCNASRHTTPVCELDDLILHELESYFNDSYHRFHLPLKPHGTSYRQRVWNALLVIPAGQTLTYGELAQKLQSSPRAIGQACKNNPLALFIPCHRVVGKDNFGGYMGQQMALPYKLALLKHEVPTLSFCKV